MYIARIIRLFIITLLFSNGIALANTIETVTTSAMAETEDKAITKALAQAIQQVNGVQVDVNTQLQETGTQLVINWLGNQTILEGQEINRGYTNIQSAGPVESYKVLSSEFLKAQNLWKSTIEAHIVKYTNIGEDRSKLIQLSVAPFRTSQASFQMIDGTKPAKRVSAKLNRHLTESFVQSQRFRVLDRSFWHEANTEMLITDNFGRATQDSIKQGQKLGADYILVGLINKLAITKNEEKVYNSINTNYEAEFDISLRVIEVATSDIIWNHTYKNRFDKKELRSQLKTLRPDPFQKTEFEAAIEMQDGLLELVSKDISRKVITHFYPIKVLSLEDGILLSQGGSQLMKDELYLIYSSARTIKDPDTGMSIQTRGVEIATVQVTEVFDDHARAVLIDGSLQRIKKGAIATLKKEATENHPLKNHEPRPLTPGSSEKPVNWR